MLSAYGKAIEQLPDRQFLKVVLLGIAGAILAMIALWTGAKWSLNQVPWTEIPLIGGLFEWMGEYAADLGWVSFIIGAGGLTWLLFPVAAVAVISLFLDTVCIAVEKKHYPTRVDSARDQPILEAVFGALKFLGITILANMIALPFYLLLLLAFGTGAFLFIFVNGYLVSREFFELVAVRRMPLRNAGRLYRAYRWQLVLFGMLGVFLMMIPMVNLIAPILIAAAMVHVYESLPRKGEFEAQHTGGDLSSSSGPST